MKWDWEGVKFTLQRCVGGERQAAGNFFLKNFVLMFQEEPETSLLTWRRTVEPSRAGRSMTVKTKTL